MIDFSPCLIFAKEPVLPSNREGSYRSFSGIVVDGVMAVFKITDQTIPLIV